jgi:hypothetical protein
MWRVIEPAVSCPGRAAAPTSCAGLTRVSIDLRKSRSKRMDGRVIPDQVEDRRPAMTGIRISSPPALYPPLRQLLSLRCGEPRRNCKAATAGGLQLSR